MSKIQFISDKINPERINPSTQTQQMRNKTILNCLFIIKELCFKPVLKRSNSVSFKIFYDKIKEKFYEKRQVNSVSHIRNIYHKDSSFAKKNQRLNEYWRCVSKNNNLKCMKYTFSHVNDIFFCFTNRVAHTHKCNISKLKTFKKSMKKSVKASTNLEKFFKIEKFDWQFSKTIIFLNIKKIINSKLISCGLNEIFRKIFIDNSYCCFCFDSIDQVFAVGCFDLRSKEGNVFIELHYIASNVKGYGKQILHHIKEFGKTNLPPAKEIVAFADIGAIGFFQKSGFYFPWIFNKYGVTRYYKARYMEFLII